MKTSLSHLPQNKQQELERVIKLIVETVNPEKIILFGSHATGSWVEDSYTEGHITYEYISDYDLLVITKPGERKTDYEVTDQVENRLRFRTPVNVITHDIEYVNRQLGEGQYFFSDITKEGILLYDASTIPLAERRELAPTEIRERANNDFAKWFESGNEFLIDAINAFNRGSFKKAAFELHQATERFYNTVILVFTGYKPKTHNLEKLRSFAKRFSKELHSLFPKNTPQEEHLFNLLLKGYVEARYSDTYTITKEEVEIIIERIGKMKTLIESICRNHITQL